MLIQMHRQRIDDLHTTEFVAQTEVQYGMNDSQIFATLRKWTRAVQLRHQLPDGWQWLMVKEGSRSFVIAAESPPDQRDSDDEPTEETGGE